MSKPRSKLPALTAFGSVLRQLREGRNLSTGQVEKRFSEATTKLSRSTLSQYEKGTVWAPDVIVVAELATIYRFDLSALLVVLKANRENPALSIDEANALMQGAPHAGADASRLLEESYAHAMRDVRDIARRLIKISERAKRLSDLGEGAEAAGSTPGGGGSH